MFDKLYAAMLTLTGIGFGSYVLLEEATNAVAGEHLGESCARPRLIGITAVGQSPHVRHSPPPALAHLGFSTDPRSHVITS